MWRASPCYTSFLSGFHPPTPCYGIPDRPCVQENAVFPSTPRRGDYLGDAIPRAFQTAIGPAFDVTSEPAIQSASLPAFDPAFVPATFPAIGPASARAIQTAIAPAIPLALLLALLLAFPLASLPASLPASPLASLHNSTPLTAVSTGFDLIFLDAGRARSARPKGRVLAELFRLPVRGRVTQSRPPA